MTKFWTRRVYAGSCATFCQKSFPTIIGDHREFLRKTHLSQKQCEIERFQLKLLNPRVYPESFSPFCINHFPTIFDGHLEFLHKTQNREPSDTFQESILLLFFAGRLNFGIN